MLGRPVVASVGLGSWRRSRSAVSSRCGGEGGDVEADERSPAAARAASTRVGPVGLERSRGCRPGGPRSKIGLANASITGATAAHSSGSNRAATACISSSVELRPPTLGPQAPPPLGRVLTVAGRGPDLGGPLPGVGQVMGLLRLGRPARPPRPGRPRRHRRSRRPHPATGRRCANASAVAGQRLQPAGGVDGPLRLAHATCRSGGPTSHRATRPAAGWARQASTRSANPACLAVNRRITLARPLDRDHRVSTRVQRRIGLVAPQPDHPSRRRPAWPSGGWWGRKGTPSPYTNGCSTTTETTETSGDLSSDRPATARRSRCCCRRRCQATADELDTRDPRSCGRARPRCRCKSGRTAGTADRTLARGPRVDDHR